MAAFLFQIDLPEITEEIAAIIPDHRDHINKLFEDGRMLSYSVSQHRSLIWCVIASEDEQESMQIVLQFPLYPYFTDIVCHPLLFHNALSTALPGISLN